MKRCQQSPKKIALQKCWGRWTQIVELFARRQPAQRRVDPKSYVALRRELIEHCQAMAASANDVDAIFYRYLEDLVQPWLDPVVLSRTDRDILFDLLIRCKDAQSQLRGHSWIRIFPSMTAPTLVVALLFAITPLWLGRLLVLLLTIVNRARSWSDELWFNVTYASSVHWMSSIGCALLVISVYLVYRTSRS
jgi:hypothetical protein